MKTPLRSLAAAAYVALLVAGCSSNGSSGSGDSTGTASNSGLPADLVAAAQKEGQLAMATSDNINAADSKIFDAFAKQFNIRVTQRSGNTSELNSRILAERSQGVHSVDVAVLGDTGHTNFLKANAYVPILDDIVIPDFQQDRSDWYAPTIPFLAADKDQKYVTDYLVRVDPNLTRTYYNTDKINKSALDQLTSMQDFATNPKWKGKIVIPDVGDGAADGGLTGLQYTWMFLGADWFNALFKNNTPIVVGPSQSRQIVDGLAQGKWWVCLFCDEISADAAKAHSDGLPVSELNKTLKEGPATDTTGHMAIFEGAPHPNAAKLFINWILTKDGQTAVNKYIDPAVASGAAALRKSAPQGNQPDDLWNDLHNFKLEFATPQDLQKSKDEVQPFIHKLFVQYGLNTSP
jgi:ABC-type Fe3+ transport system substrate-binding protein